MITRMTDGLTLRMERTYRAPAQAVFDAWTSEEVLRRWFHAGRARGRCAPSAG